MDNNTLTLGLHWLIVLEGEWLLLLKKKVYVRNVHPVPHHLYIPGWILPLQWAVGVLVLVPLKIKKCRQGC